MLSHVLDGGYLTELDAPVPMPVDEDGLLTITGDTLTIGLHPVKSLNLLTG